MVSYPSQPVISKTKETSVMGQPGFHRVLLLALCLFKTAVCDVDASTINSLRSGTCITIGKIKNKDKQTNNSGDFPSSPVTTPSSQCRGPGFKPWSGI